MKAKRAFIIAYTKQNLGDDLFIYMLLKKYPNIQFYINIEKKEYANAFEEFENLTIYQEKARKLEKENANDYDMYIYIGGSIFMEGVGKNYTVTAGFLEFMEECKKNEIPFYYISSNFGPYYTEEYLELAKKVFRNCTSICFRDTYSKNLFVNIPTVHYAPDLVFSYLPEKVEKKANSVGISMIDLNIRSKLVSYKQKYYSMLEKNIKKYINQGKEVTLFSFCRYEGDERAIEEFVNILSKDLSSKIKIVRYNGNLKYFLNEYNKMEYMICARFHAMILSVIMQQKCEIMSYSNKIDNVINDLYLFDENIVHFEQIMEGTEMNLSKFKKVEYKKIEDIAKRATRQLYIEGL